MNMIALLAAVVGFVIFLILFFVGKKIENKFLSGFIQIIGIVLGIVAMSFVTKAYGTDLQVSSKAGAYFFYLLVLTVIIQFLIKKIKK
jgi:hypothetical protein